MKLYSDKITKDVLTNAFYKARNENGADIWLDESSYFRPRLTIFASGLKFYASSRYGNHASGHRPIGTYPLDDVPRAASWTDYGYVIAHLFNTDPEAKIGDYNGVADFRAKIAEPYNAKRGSTDFLGVLRAS